MSARTLVGLDELGGGPGVDESLVVDDWSGVDVVDEVPHAWKQPVYEPPVDEMQHRTGAVGRVAPPVEHVVAGAGAHAGRRDEYQVDTAVALARTTA